MKKLLALAVAMVPLMSEAHPGHGNENPLSPGHYVNNPGHAIPLALTIAAAIVVANWLAARYIRKNSK